MLSTKFKVFAALIVSSFTVAATLFALNGNAISMDTVADSNKTATFTNSDLARFKTSETGAYRLHPVTFGGKNDHSFRIPLPDGKYVNGLLLHGDCGNQTITDLGNYVTARHSGGAEKEYFNYNLVLGFKGIVSVQMSVTVTIANADTDAEAIFNVTTSTSVISDAFIVDDHSEASLPTQISRDGSGGPCYEYLFGRDTELTTSYTAETSKLGTKDSNANAVTFRINGYMSNATGENSVNVRINELSVTYSC